MSAEAVTFGKPPAGTKVKLTALFAITLRSILWTFSKSTNT